MTPHSNCFIRQPQPEADRIVALLEAADFTPEEISMIVPRARPVLVSQPSHPAPNPPTVATGSGEHEIRILVHSLDGGRRGRAEAIFGSADREVVPSIKSEDESPHSWVKPLFSKTRR
jgi:hypothetical protein